MSGTYEVIINGLFGNVEKSSCEGLTLIGSCFIGNELQKPDQIKEFLCANIISGNESELSKLNGFFAIVLKYNEEIYLVSDKVRSRPLFYSETQVKIVSDNFYTIIDKSDRFSLDKLSCEEYLYTGYVTGCETLVGDVYQVEAAQIVRIDKKGLISRKNYWYFLPEKNLIANDTKEYWYKQLDLALKQSIERLIHLANGRQIIIPLSGGYDSRVIALYLKISGYENLVCFTFGRQMSHEVAMSRRIAQVLDIEWYNVQYTRKMWGNIKNSTEFSEYIDHISSGVSVANIQVYPAIKKLISDGVVNKSAIVVPGHTGDFVAGGHFNKSDLDSSDSRGYSKKMLVNKHYKHKTDCPRSGLIKKLSTGIFLNDFSRDDYRNEVGIAEAWECRERQSKFIANSNRYYDYFGLSWWMPFWDNDFIGTWEKVPYSLRLNTVLWNDFVNKKMFEYAGHAAPLGRSNPKRNLAQKIKIRLNYFTDSNGLFALVPFDRWLFFQLKLSSKSGTVFGVLSENYLATLRKRLEK